MPDLVRTLRVTGLVLPGLSALALLMAGLAVSGAMRGYSPVPYWDMWDGYLGFFLQVQDGKIGAWWAQHNEHRLLLSHITFWFDLAWFGGRGLPLIALNYMLALASAAMFWQILRHRSPHAGPDRAELAFGLMLSIWLCSWMQYENLASPFQNQFFLAQLLPLCACFWLYRAGHENHGRGWFALACGAGAASAGAMANGVLVLPLMLVFSLLTQQNWRRLTVLGALTLLVLSAYFYGYVTPPGPGSLSKALQEDLFGLLTYLFDYLGSPFYFLLGGRVGKLLAPLAGIFLVGCCCVRSVQVLRKPQDRFGLMLLLYLLFIGGTALGTAGGRVHLGIDQAFSSRYTTPALMAWAALAVLHKDSVLAAIAMRRWPVLIPVALVLLLLLRYQLHAPRSQGSVPFERDLAGLALALDVNHPAQLEKVYPDASRVRLIAARAVERRVGIFGAAPYVGIRARLGTTVAAPLPVCAGRLEAAVMLPDEPRFVQIEGWLYDPGRTGTGPLLQLRDSAGKVAGFALTGTAPPHPVQGASGQHRRSGFRGYALASALGGQVSVLADGGSCQLPALLARSTR